MPGVAPSDLDFVVDSPFTGVLTWQNNNDDPPHDEYQYIEIWENRAAAGYGATPKIVIAGYKESYVLTGLDPGINYQYKVLGGWWEPPGETADSNEDDETMFLELQDPTDIETTVFSDFVEIIWKDNSFGEDTFRIERNDGGWHEIGNVATNMEYYRDTTVAVGVVYTYRVRAKQNGGFSAYVTGVAVTANNVPNNPAGATISEVTDEEMRVTWTAPAAGFEVTGYKIQISDTGAFGGEEIEYIVADDVLTYFFKGLTPSQQYWIRVYSYNGVGDSAGFSADNDTCLAKYVRSDFEVFVRDPIIKPVYIAEIDLKMDLVGFPLMSDDNLKGCWPFDETSGMIATDKSKQGNDGSLENMEEGDHVGGKVNNGLTFDGVNEYVNIPGNANLDTPNAFTVAAWIYDPTENQRHSINKDSGGGANRAWVIRRETNTSVNFHIWNSVNGLGQLIPAGSWAKDAWFHIACTAKIVGANIEMEVFFNGISKGTTSFAGTAIKVLTAQPIHISKDVGGCKEQLVDEVRIYNRALTADEVKALHDTPGHRIHEIFATERGLTIDYTWEDGDEYTAKASKAQVQANALSYHHDTANRRLYIHTSAEDHPHDFLLEAGFTHRIPSRDFQYADDLCTLPPWLSESSIPGVTQENRPYFAGTFRLSTGSISFMNALSAGENYFDKRFETFTWIGSRLAIYCGEETYNSLSKFNKMFSAYISDKDIGDNKITLALRDIRKELDRDLILDRYWETDYPGLEDDFEGREKPKAFGYVEEVAPVPLERYDATEETSAKFSYHDGRSKNVGKVMVDDVEKEKGVDYFVDLQRSIITFKVTEDVSEEDIVLVSFTGTVNSADEPVENGAEMFKWLMNNEANIPTTRLNTDWIYEAKYANTKSISILFYKDTPYDEILKTIEHTIEAYILQDGDARIGIRPLQTTVPSRAKYIWNFQSKGHRHNKSRDSLYWKVKVYYGEKTQTQEWEVKEATDNDIKWKFGVEKELPIYTYFRDPSNAQDLADKILNDFLNKTFIVDELPMILFDVLPGDLVPFSRDRFFDSSGVAVEIELRVLRIEKNPQTGKTGVILEKV